MTIDRNQRADKSFVFKMQFEKSFDTKMDSLGQLLTWANFRSFVKLTTLIKFNSFKFSSQLLVGHESQKGNS